MARVAMVSGGSRGIGRAIALELRARGMRVAVNCRRDGEEARELREQADIAVYCWDVGDLRACRDGMERVAAELGPVDVLVNNAGITADAMFHKMDEEQWWSVLRTNLGSMYNMTRQVIDGMRERRYGRIVNISSVNGRKGQAGQCNYAAAKAGILGFTRSLALENAGRNITVNAVAPGYCDTAMVSGVRTDVLQAIVAGIPVGRLGSPEDIARVVAFLVDEGAGFITGATIDVNGGQYLA